MGLFNARRCGGAGNFLFVGHAIGHILANFVPFDGDLGIGVPAASLANEIDTAGLPFVKWNGAEVPAAFGQVFDLLRDRSMRHLPHPALDAAATSAASKVHPDGGRVIDASKSPTDTAPLTAVLGAVWGLGHLPDDRPSIYSGADGADVLVL